MVAEVHAAPESGLSRLADLMPAVLPLRLAVLGFGSCYGGVRLLLHLPYYYVLAVPCI